MHQWCDVGGANQDIGGKALGGWGLVYTFTISVDHTHWNMALRFTRSVGNTVHTVHIYVIP